MAHCSLDKKAETLYNEHYVNYLRVCCKENTFFHGEVRAEMKAITYKVDVSLTSTGVVADCQCECAAGMGPSAHCKHVRCVLIGLLDFAQQGKFLTVQTCTQELQSFHRPKQHTGSPVKARDLTLTRSQLMAVRFNPRYPLMINLPSYPSGIFSSLINARCFSTAPILQCMMPVNIRGLAHDHVYFEDYPHVAFLKQAGLMEIDETTTKAIEEKTRKSKKVWKEERCKRICSSDFGCISKLTARADTKKLSERLMSRRELRTRAVMPSRNSSASLSLTTF